MTIHPDTLRAHRNRSKLSQEALAALSRVSKKTISRIEGGKVDPDKIRSTTVELLAKTLGVKPEDLARAPGYNDRDKVLREVGYRKLKTYIDTKTALAYNLMERRYKVSIQSQIEMAPLFFALLAEGSLAWRREKLKELREAADRLYGIEAIAKHLSFAAECANRAHDGAADEEASIEKCDLFGEEVGEDDLDFGYDPSVTNPFAEYLRKLAADLDPAIVELDPLGLELGWKTKGMPDYEVGRVELDRITGQDRWATYALERGHARIRDIPEELQNDEASKARIAWLTARIPQDELEKQKRLDVKLSISA